MAGIYPSHPDDIGSEVARMREQLESLARTPAAGNESISEGAQVVVDNHNDARTLHGLYTWPTAPWAGNKIYGVVVFDASEHPVVVCGQQPDGLYGLGIYNPSGEREVLLGKQPITGDYGLSIVNLAGVLQQVGGALYDFDFAGISGYSSSSYSSPTASVTARLGSSHQALVTFGMTVAVRALNARSALFVDGVFQSATVLQSSSPTSGAATQSNGTFLVTAPSAGDHVFDVRVATGVSGAGGSDADFFSISLTVQPL